MKYSDEGYFDAVTSSALMFTREAGKQAGLNLGTVLMGDDPASSPAAMVLEMPPGYVLERHAHDCHRTEVVVRGSVTLENGDVLTAGDVSTSKPGEFYGPHTAGPEGALTVEIFSTAAGFAPIPADGATSETASMVNDIRSQIGAAQGTQNS